MRLNGVDARLYPLVGPLVMNPAILRQNNNYPFKTSNRYLWYIAISDGVIVGFIPLKKNEKELPYRQLLHTRRPYGND